MKGADPRIVDGPGGLTGARLLRALLIGCIAGLLLGSRPLAAWTEARADQLGPVAALAARWDGVMAGAGLTMPYDAVHRWIRALLEP